MTRLSATVIRRTIRSRLFAPRPQEIPIVIVNFNRLTYLRRLLDRLERDGFQEIWVLDNASTYEPLLDYYATCPAKVVRFQENAGKWVLWRTNVWDRFRHRFYVYTDPDVVPDPSCPPDYAQRFLDVLGKYPALDKVGFGLRLDDLPEHYAKRAAVLEHEARHWQKLIEPGLYRAPIDTTFALYRPGVQGLYELNAARLGPPYVARHLTWYEDSSHPTAEERYYLDAVRAFNAGVDESSKRTHWHRD